MQRALLVIDVQDEYFHGSLPVSHPAGSLDNILAAMDAAESPLENVRQDLLYSIPGGRRESRKVQPRIETPQKRAA